MRMNRSIMKYAIWIKRTDYELELECNTEN